MDTDFIRYINTYFHSHLLESKILVIWSHILMILTFSNYDFFYQNFFSGQYLTDDQYSRISFWRPKIFVIWADFLLIFDLVRVMTFWSKLLERSVIKDMDPERYFGNNYHTPCFRHCVIQGHIGRCPYLNTTTTTTTTTVRHCPF